MTNTTGREGIVRWILLGFPIEIYKTMLSVGRDEPREMKQLSAVMETVTIVIVATSAKLGFKRGRLAAIICGIAGLWVGSYVQIVILTIWIAATDDGLSV